MAPFFLAFSYFDVPLLILGKIDVIRKTRGFRDTETAALEGGKG